MNNIKKIIFLMTVFGILAGCTKSSEVSGVSSESSTAEVETNMCTAPVTTVVDYGQRATTSITLALRGAYSSLALIPGTTYPGVVFSETHAAGATSVKYMYWDGSAFKYETIASGIGATYIKLVYLTTADPLTNGIPLVFWGNGTNTLYGAARSSASTTTEGTWTVLALDATSGLLRGLEASVNPDGEVAIVFMMNSNVASGTKSILCQSNCHTMTATNFPAATVVDAINTSTNSYSVGAAWCNSGTQYYPVYFYGSTANFRLSTCRQSDLSTCNGNWNAGIIGAANANRLSTSMYIDPTATNGTVYMTGLGGAGIIPYTMTSCATNPALATWGNVTTGTAFGLLTTGNAWHSLDRDSSGMFHVTANEAQVSIRYFNSSTANFVTGAWSAAPATNYTETTGALGLPAPGATRGSMVIDNTNDQVLASYGRAAVLSPAATWGNVVIAYNECPSGVGAPACSATTLGSAGNSTGMWWGNMPADISGQIQKTSLAWPNVSTAVTSDGTPAVTYSDYSVSGTPDPVVGVRLKYAYRDGSTASSPWNISVIGTTSSAQSPSLAFDENDLPWITWTEPPAAAVSQKFFLATNTRTDGQGVWTIYQFPVYYLLGAATAQPVMAQSAIAMYEVAGVRHPMVVTMSSIGTAAGREVRAGLFNKTTRLWSNVKQIATFVGNLTIGGAWLSADSDANGNVVVAFNDMSTGVLQLNCSATSRCIRFGYTTDGGATWSMTSTSGVINGLYEAAKVKLNPENSRPAITYFDRANSMLRYKYCSTALATCTSSTNWSDLGVGIIDASLGITGLAELTNLGVVDSGFTFTNDGLPWVVYPRGAGAATNPNLMFNGVTTAGGVFGSSSVLYTNPGVGNLTGAIANNTALSWNPSSARSTETGSLHTAFIGPGNFLYMTSCGN